MGKGWGSAPHGGVVRSKTGRGGDFAGTTAPARASTYDAIARGETLPKTLAQEENDEKSGMAEMGRLERTGAPRGSRARDGGPRGRHRSALRCVDGLRHPVAHRRAAGRDQLQGVWRADRERGSRQ